jgi:peptidoglycan hydrolase-like protein with peptidoglycan-binding domain/V8-like Glu-specific endopeptidase
MTTSTFQTLAKNFWLTQWLILNTTIPLPKGSPWPTIPGGNIPHKIPFEREPKTLSQQEIIQLAQEKVFSQKKLLMTTAPSQRDLLPAASLQTGTARSLSVCRITKSFSRSNFEEFIQQIIQVIKETHQGKGFDSIAALCEIFLISEPLADEIFGEVKDQLQPVSSKTDSSLNSNPSLHNSEILLNALAGIKEAQLAKLNPIPVGTGFLVGVTHLLTNHHVIWDKEIARQCVAQFNYAEDASGSTQQTLEYELDSEALFASEPSLDYTLVQLKSNQSNRQAGYNFGWIQMAEDEGNIVPGLDDKLREALKKALVEDRADFSESDLLGDNVFIIHHPKGNQKKVDLSNNRVIENGLFKDILRYQGDSDFGSSGSPVFNTRWELVALHHAAIPIQNAKGDRTPQGFYQQGIRICRIVEDLKRKSAWNPKLRGFIDDFVVTAEQLHYPPLSSAIGLNGLSHYAILGEETNIPDLPQNIPDLPQFSIEAWVNPSLASLSSVIFSKVCHEAGWNDAFRRRWQLQEDPVFDQYIESLYLTRNREIVFAVRPFWRISSIAFPEQGWLYSKIKIGDTPQHPIEILRPGSRFKSWEKIKALQSILYHLGLYHVGSNADDRFDPADYQTRLTGEIDAVTQAAYDQFFQRIALNSELDIKALVNDAQNNTDQTIIDRVQDVIEIFNAKGLALLPIGIPGQDLVLNNQNAPPHRGFRVVELQASLKNLAAKHPQDLEFQTLEITGVFDAATETAVMKLQKRNGLKQDGVFGLRALKALEFESTSEVRTREALPPGQFSHVAVTRNSQSETKIYINGQLVARRSTEMRRLGTISKTILGASANRDSWTSSGGNQPQYRSFFRGALAEVRFWNGELTRSQIAEFLHQRLIASQHPSLIGYWSFEEGCRDGSLTLNNLVDSDYFLPQTEISEISSEPIADLDADHDPPPSFPDVRWLTATNFPVVPLTFGMQFDARTDQIDCFDGKASDQAPIQGITVELWMKQQFGNGVLLSRTGVSSYTLALEDNQIKVELKNKRHISQVKTQACFPLDQSWHHVAFTWSEATKELVLYIDGNRQNVHILQGEGKSYVDRNANISSGIFRGTFQGNLTQNLILGSKPDPRPSQSVLFKGAIADLRLWKTERNQTDIKTNLSRRLNLKPTRDASDFEHLVAYWRLDDGSGSRMTNLVTEAKSAEAFSPTRPPIWISPPQTMIEFSDISADHVHWARKFIYGLVNLGLIGGFTNLTTINRTLNFVPTIWNENTKENDPQDWMTKAEFAALLVRSFGGKPKPNRLKPPEFYDQGIQQSPYFPEIQYAYQLGLISESRRNEQGNLAEYDKHLDRQEVIDALIDSMRQSVVKDISQNLQEQYEDFESTQLWMDEAKLKTALVRGIVVRGQEQSTRTLELERIATRAEIAAMVYQALVWLKQAPAIESDYIQTL